VLGFDVHALYLASVGPDPMQAADPERPLSVAGQDEPTVRRLVLGDSS